MLMAMGTSLMRSGHSRALTMVAVFAAAAAAASPAQAQTWPPGEFRLDVYRGPVLGSSRIIGLGGAYAGIAEGIEGYFRTPAAISNRGRHEVDWFEYDLTFDWLISPGSAIDFDNDGRRGSADTRLMAFDVGASLRFAPFGLGVHFVPTTYELRLPGDVVYEASAWELLIGAAWAFLDAELLLGAGVGIRGLTLTQFKPDQAEMGFTAIGFDAGLLWRPPSVPVRFGASFRYPSTLRPDSPIVDFAGYPIPSGVSVPWTVTAGASLMLGPAADTYNMPHGGDERPWGEDVILEDRRYVLFALDAVFIGPVAPETYNIEGYVSGAPRRLHSTVTGSLHFGLESEVWHDRLKLRVGTYSEPDRVHGHIVGRMHVTGGAELRLFDLWIWRFKLTGGVDWAPRYLNLLFGVGFWH